MDPGAEVIRLAVFGNPVRQSLSPRIHAAFADQVGLEVDYRAIEAPLDGFEDSVRRFSAAGALGCNVTLPFKQQAYALAGQHSETARRASAANTLVFGERWFADNTDGRGLLWDLRNHGLDTLEGLHVAVLGAGGAAAGVLAALLLARPRRLTLANRTLDKATALIETHADLGELAACTPANLPGSEAIDLLINATSMGHAGESPPLDRSWLASNAFVYDLNYGKAALPLAAWCRTRELRYGDGLGMLVGQAAESFRLWTDRSPDATRVLDQLRSRLFG